MPISLTNLIDASYKGDQGDQGSVGTQGTQGVSGVQGVQGLSGIVNAKTYTFTASGGVYYVDSVQQDTLHLIRGQKYIFDGSGATSHPIRLSTDSNNSTAYTSGYTTTAGNVNTFIVPYDAPDTLYYYCNVHSNMGGLISIKDLTGNDLGLSSSDAEVTIVSCLFT